MHNNLVLEDLFSFSYLTLYNSKNLKHILSQEIKLKWKEDLIQIPDCYNYHLKPVGYNLLKIILLASHFEGGLRLPRIVLGYHMFKRLDGYLSIFPFLMESKSFLNQMINLTDSHFTLLFSQLTLAAYFKRHGFEVHFQCTDLGYFTDEPMRIKDSGGNAVKFLMMKIRSGAAAKHFSSKKNTKNIASVKFTQLIDNYGIHDLANQTIMIAVPTLLNLPPVIGHHHFKPSTYLKLVTDFQLLEDQPAIIFMLDNFIDGDVSSAMDRLSIQLFYDNERLSIPTEIN